MIGYHARAGAYGVLAHTINGSAFAEIRVNGVPVGEYFLNGLLAGACGVPVRLLSGDDCLAAEAAAVFPHAEIVTVKRALSTRAAVHSHPEIVHKALREAGAPCPAQPPVPSAVPPRALCGAAFHGADLPCRSLCGHAGRGTAFARLRGLHGGHAP